MSSQILKHSIFHLQKNFPWKQTLKYFPSNLNVTLMINLHIYWAETKPPCILFPLKSSEVILEELC